jgi:hypothetical protein
MKSDPADASAPFNLGNMLRANGRYVEAEVAVRTATRVDPTYAQAWYNLADLLDDQGRANAAIECLRKALRVAPAYADATFNLALLLQRKNQYAEAANHWRRYLAHDCWSEWAARARKAPVDLIVASGDETVRVLQQTTNTIPIVAIVGDMLGSRLVTSLARSPGGARTARARSRRTAPPSSTTCCRS